MNQLLWSLNIIQFWGPSCKKILKKEYKIRYEIEYLFRIRKEITTNYKFKKGDKCHTYNKI
jgi:hypothetical protein